MWRRRDQHYFGTEIGYPLFCFMLNDVPMLGVATLVHMLMLSDEWKIWNSSLYLLVTYDIVHDSDYNYSVLFKFNI